MSTTNPPTTTPLLSPPTLPAHWTLSDVCEHVGGISPQRILAIPAPGMATEQDALSLEDREDRLYELVDGILVEKVMSFYESILAVQLAYLINAYLESNSLGIVAGADGQIRLLPTKMRIPDLAFIRWERFPGGILSKDRVCKVPPDLAVEILSPGNTRREMELKLDEYFEAGVRLVWYIDAQSRTASIYVSRHQMQAIDESGHLDGLDVLPGFSVRLGELFERADRRQGG